MRFKSRHGFIRIESMASLTVTSQTIPFGEDLMISSSVRNVLEVLEVLEVKATGSNHILTGEAKF
jgi:hypothetical protein